MDQLKQLLQSNMIRRLKEDVLDLPDKVEITEYVENTPYQKKLERSVIEDLVSHRDQIVSSLNPLAKMLRLRQVNGSPELVDQECELTPSYLNKNAKLKRLIELVDDILIRDEKVVIFSNWVEPLRTVYRFLSKYYTVCCFTGTMSEADRQKHKDLFLRDARCKILIGTIGALGTTHTLTAANNIIFYDEPWQAADRNQAIDRCHRIGTSKTCNIYTLLSKNTIDERVHNILYRKDTISKFIVDDKLDIYNNPELFL
jgi:SNF2 family DNA or RNA helicase